jgi:hypothetical protein
MPDDRARVSAERLLEACQRVDANARVTSVTKTNADETLVKISPSADAGAAVGLAMVTAVKVFFPLCTVSAVESAASGLLELQVVVHGSHDELVQAMRKASERRSMRALGALKKTTFFGAMGSFVALFYASVILPMAA